MPNYSDQISLLESFFYLLRKYANKEMLSESLKIFANIKDPQTAAIRRGFIHDHVYHSERRVRHSALVAIEEMEHYQSIPVLEEYISWETFGYLRRHAMNILQHFLLQYNNVSLQEIPITVLTNSVEEHLSGFHSSPSQLTIVDAIGVSLDPSLVVPQGGTRPPVLPLTFQNPKKEV